MTNDEANGNLIQRWIVWIVLDFEALKELGA